MISKKKIVQKKYPKKIYTLNILIFDWKKIYFKV